MNESRKGESARKVSKYKFVVALSFLYLSSAVDWLDSDGPIVVVLSMIESRKVDSARKVSKNKEQ